MFRAITERTTEKSLEIFLTKSQKHFQNRNVMEISSGFPQKIPGGTIGGTSQGILEDFLKEFLEQLLGEFVRYF